MDYASLHILGCTKEQAKSLIYPNTDIPVLSRELTPSEADKLITIEQLIGKTFLSDFKRESFEYTFLKQEYCFTENIFGCSVFSPAFDTYSLPDRIKLSFEYDNAPIVLGFATEYESVIHIWLYKNGKIISEICYCCDFDELRKWCDVSDFEFCFRDVKLFKDYFNFNEFELIELLKSSKSFNVLCKQISIMFALPLTLTFEMAVKVQGAGLQKSIETGAVLFINDFR